MSLLFAKKQIKRSAFTIVNVINVTLRIEQFIHAARDVAAAPQTPQLGGGPGQLWGPKLV